jgi:Protein of unknown function (DUF 659)
MLDVAASFGLGYRGPNFHEIHGYLLEKNVEEAKNFVEGFHNVWKETDCKYPNEKNIDKLLSVVSKGNYILKVQWCNRSLKNYRDVFQMFKEVVQFIGSENVMHIVTDNASNYVSVGKYF